MKIILPLPPSVNALYGGGSRQKRFPTKAYKEWLKETENMGYETPCFSSVYISYFFYFPDNRVRDSANFIKAIDDWLVNNKIIKDDCWHVLKGQRIIPMGIDKDSPRVEIDILNQET